MHINRLRPRPGDDLALFLSGVVNDAIRDATEAGLGNTDAVRIVFGLAQIWQVCGPPATRHHGQTPCVTRSVGGERAVCVYLSDGTKVRVARAALAEVARLREALGTICLTTDKELLTGSWPNSLAALHEIDETAHTALKNEEEPKT